GREERDVAADLESSHDAIRVADVSRAARDLVVVVAIDAALENALGKASAEGDAMVMTLLDEWQPHLLHGVTLRGGPVDGDERGGEGGNGEGGRKARRKCEGHGVSKARGEKGERRALQDS